MRLLNVETLRLETPEACGQPLPYAILSHTWLRGGQEISFQELQAMHTAAGNSAGRAIPGSKEGFQKIKGCCAEAARRGLGFVWADTCCIDKTDSAELSRSINSMFRWYKESAVCLAYLADVSVSAPGVKADGGSGDWRDDFRRSHWFGRGWTLQELIAPPLVVFYDRDWTRLGTRRELCGMISEITKIPRSVLTDGPAAMHSACIAQKMAWASGRKTSQPEDVAYCLFGIFDVNMPLIYGEGAEKAFLRLQEEIVRTSDDESIFVWQQGTKPGKAGHRQFTGLLAASPAAFRNSANVTLAPFKLCDDASRISISQGRVDLQLVLVPRNSHGLYFAFLNCIHRRTRESEGRRVCIVVQRLSTSQFCRVYPHRLVLARQSFSTTHAFEVRAVFIKHRHCWPQPGFGFIFFVGDARHNDKIHIECSSLYPRDRFVVSRTNFAFVPPSASRIAAAETMADVCDMRRVLEGVVTYAVVIRGENGTGARSVVHRFNVLFGFEYLDTECGTESQRLQPWCAISHCRSTPNRMVALSTKKPFRAALFWKPTDAWREVIVDAPGSQQQRLEYDIPKSDYLTVEGEGAKEVRHLITRVSLSLRDQLFRGILMNSVILRVHRTIDWGRI